MFDYIIISLFYMKHPALWYNVNHILTFAVFVIPYPGAVTIAAVYKAV